MLIWLKRTPEKSGVFVFLWKTLWKTKDQKNIKKFQKTFEKGIDKTRIACYNIYSSRGTPQIKKERKKKMIEIARIMTIATANNRDIIRRLMGVCDSFKGMTFATAAETYRYYERNGLVKKCDGYLVIYHDCGK